MKKINFKEDTKKFKELEKYKVRCKCSHTIIMIDADRAICSYCGNWIYRTPEIEFKYKIKQKMKEV